MARVSFALLLALLHLSAAGAQTPDSAAAGALTARDIPPRPATSARGARVRGAPPGQLWSADVTLSGIYDSNADRDDSEEATQGLSAEVTLGRQDHASRPSKRMEYGVTARAYTRSERWNRVSHRLRAAYDRNLAARWRLGVDGALSLGIPTTEYRRADQLFVAPALDYEPDRAQRVRVYVGLRERWYHDPARSRAFSPYVGGEYRYRFGAWYYGYLTYRHESNRADRDSLRFDRSTYGAEYAAPLTKRDRIRFRLLYRTERYAGQPVASNAGIVDRRDQRWIPSTSWTRDVDDRLRLQASYRFLARRTNGTRADFESHRLAIAARYHWGAR